MNADTQLIIFGAGGHGRVVADVASSTGKPAAGFVDDDPARYNERSLPLPLLGDGAWLCSAQRDGCKIALGVGDNYARSKVAEFLRTSGFEIATIISPFAVISPSAQIGSGTVVMPGAMVNAMAVIGQGVIVNTGAVVEHDTKVGNFAHLSPHSTLGGGAEVGDFAHVAIGAIVLPLIRVGARSILGAGSVAVRNVPDDVIAFGVPARVARTLLAKDEEESE